MINTEMQNFQQEKRKGDDNSLTCIEDYYPTLVILDVVNRGKNVTGTTRQRMAVFGTTQHVLRKVSMALIGHTACQ